MPYKSTLLIQTLQNKLILAVIPFWNEQLMAVKHTLLSSSDGFYTFFQALCLHLAI